RHDQGTNFQRRVGDSQRTTVRSTRSPQAMTTINRRALVTLAAALKCDDLIGDMCGLLAVHDQTAHARRPPRIPPATNYPQKKIAGKQRRHAHDLAATNADLLAQPGAINFEAVEPEAMRREAFAEGLDPSTRPIHDAPSSCLFAITTAVAAVLNWRGALELGGSQLLRDIPM